MTRRKGVSLAGPVVTEQEMKCERVSHISFKVSTCNYYAKSGGHVPLFILDSAYSHVCKVRKLERK